MTYTCPVCGKKIDRTTQQLIDDNYMVACPQCNSNLQIVGDYAYVPFDSLQLDTSVKPSQPVDCPNCGNKTSGSRHICPNCGYSLDTMPDGTIPAADSDTAAPLQGKSALYDQALQFLSQCTAITPMMLRDRFNISDEEAAQLIRQLEDGGAIGPYNNGGPRQILIPHRTLMEGYWRQMRSTDASGENPDGAQQQDGTPSRRPLSSGMGCISILLIIWLLAFGIKACTL